MDPRRLQRWVAQLMDDLDVAVGIVDPAGELLYSNGIVRRTLAAKDNIFCSELTALVQSVQRDGRIYRGAVTALQPQSVWLGRVWPLGDGHIAFLGRRSRRDALVDRLAADLGLDPAEIRLAQQVAAGRLNREIAERLRIPVGTVKSRVFALCKKLNVRNRAELAALITAATPRT